MQTGTVDKKQLAEALVWSRPRLDRKLKEDPNFPVVSRGDQAGGWRFDLDAVRSHLGVADVQIEEIQSAAIDAAQLCDAVKPPASTIVAGAPQPRPGRRSAHHEGEATARQRKDSADASLKEDRLARERGELVAAEDVRQLLTTMCARFGKNLDGIPEQAVKRLGLPDTAVGELRAMVDDIRVAMVKDAEPMLAPSTSDV